MWKDDVYYYGIGTLRTIARNYDKFDDYEPVSFIWGEVSNPFELAEYRADFDMAFRSLGKRMREVIQADIDDIPEYRLQQFYNVHSFKAKAYKRMAEHLNHLTN